MQTHNPADQKMKLLLNHREAAAALGLSERKLWGMTAPSGRSQGADISRVAPVRNLFQQRLNISPPESNRSVG